MYSVKKWKKPFGKSRRMVALTHPALELVLYRTPPARDHSVKISATRFITVSAAHPASDCNLICLHLRDVLLDTLKSDDDVEIHLLAVAEARDSSRLATTLSISFRSDFLRSRYGNTRSIKDALARVARGKDAITTGNRVI